MKLKLYLRGLGIGLLIGALALLIFGGVNVGGGSDSASDSSVTGLVTPVEAVNESEENEGALYATAYPLEAFSSSEESSEVSEEGKETLATIDEELTSTSDSISEKDDETQKAISQVLGKTSDAKENTGTSASTAATSNIEVEDGEAYVVSDDDTNTTDSSKTDTSKTDTKTDTNKTSDTDSTKASDTDTTTTSSQTTQSDTTDTTSSTSGQSVVVQIPGGSDSATVCRVLQNAGAIDDAAAFDAYLVSRGIDRYIRSGTYYITEGSSYEDIAKLITGR